MLNINATRLKTDIEHLGKIGREEDRGLYRMAFTDNDMQARHWLCEKIEEAGLALHIDGAANIYGRLNDNAHTPSVVTGSHIDTIPGAGHLDGALGVLAGLECLRTLKEHNIPLKHPVELIAFTDEEGRFGGMFGSQAIAGHLNKDKIKDATDPNGISITDAMHQQGLNALDALKAQRTPESFKAFVELHIEQGPVLDTKGMSIGVVEGINGLFKWKVRLKGQSNHAGSTPMDMRFDAFQGLAEFATQIDQILKEKARPRSVATIGHVELSPGAANVIPGVAEFTLEVRDTDTDILHMLAEIFRERITLIAQQRQLSFDIEVMSEIAPVICDQDIQNIIKTSADSLGIESLHMPSGAAHDTQVMATITASAMIFVPSINGRSHSPTEDTEWKDIEHGANVLLNTLKTLAT